MKSLLHRGFGLAVDQALCGFLALLHLRHAKRLSTREAVEKYLADCERQTRSDHFALPLELEGFHEEAPDLISWHSPALSAARFPANARARVRLFWAKRGAPTIVMLHALMSASDLGYRRWAQRFNALGWNAAFIHLPFHYSRRPRGHLNGELCCTADLVLNGDTLRQGVVEVRQLLAWLRGQGSREFGLLGTSYGGWVAAIAASLETDLRFVALLSPMANIVHALYQGPTSWVIRRQLARAGLESSLVERHSHLSSPRRGVPAGNGRTQSLIVAGTYDRIVRLSDLIALRDAWPGCELITLPQGHFGYGMIPRAVAWLTERGLLPT
jgi:pimeloyl-ACP methyl ester carboxylesterase